MIKHGRFVTKEEALNQQRAFELVDPNIVCIPQVYRFFSDERGRGYIMMEVVEGKIIDPLDDQRGSLISLFVSLTISAQSRAMSLGLLVVVPVLVSSGQMPRSLPPSRGSKKWKRGSTIGYFPEKAVCHSRIVISSYVIWTSRLEILSGNPTEKSVCWTGNLLASTLDCLNFGHCGILEKRKGHLTGCF